MRKLAICVALAAAFAPGLASATDGYFADGYGIKSKGRAGTGTAMATDAFGGANNPASMVFVGNRIDFGVDLFGFTHNDFIPEVKEYVGAATFLPMAKDADVSLFI